MKKDRDLKNKVADLDKVNTELREVQGQLSTMYRTPKSLPEYSSAKIDAWQREQAKLQERKDKLLAEIDELSQDPARLQEIVNRSAVLNARLIELRTKHDALKRQYNDLRYGMAEQVAEGGDPVALSAQLTGLQKQIEDIQRAVQAINEGLVFLARLRHK